MKVVVAVCVVAVLLVALKLDIRPGAPRLPETPPSEAARVTHPMGFSFVTPPGWTVSTWPDGMATFPGSKRLRDFLAFGVQVHESDIDMNVEGFHEIVISGFKAYEQTSPAHCHDMPVLTCVVLLKHGDYCYELWCYIPNGSSDAPAHSEMPDIMMRYIRSFRPAHQTAVNDRPA